MTLKNQLEDALGRLREGARIDRGEVITLMDAAAGAISSSTPEAQVSRVTGDAQFNRNESTPVRFPAKNWTQSSCKRCLRKGAPDGAIIVRIFGTGWWCDECYRVVNPDFYKGLA